jgi:hypothetical protein
MSKREQNQKPPKQASKPNPPPPPPQAKEEQQPEHVEVAAVEQNALAVMERASIDMQIETAHRHPRSISKFLSDAKSLIAVDEETAESCIYRRPVGKEGGQDVYAEGMSVRLAEIVAATYHNIRAQAIITQMMPRYVKAAGFAHDLESNVAFTAEVVESTVTSSGYPYSEHMRVTVAKAAQSKALRDAIFRVIPRSVCKPLEEHARYIAFGGGSKETIELRRGRLLEWVSKISVSPERVYAALNVQGLEDVGIEQLETLAGLRTAIKDGDTTIDEAFPPLAESDDDKGVQGLKKKLANKAKKPAEPPPPATPPQTGTAKQKPVASPAPAAGGKPKDWCPYCKAVIPPDKQAANKAGEQECNECGYVLVVRP